MMGTWGSMEVPQSISERRARVISVVRAWCRARQIPVQDFSPSDGVTDLSDRAALLIATGYLDAPTRVIVLERLRTGRLFPDVGGFANLRRLADEHADMVRRFADAKSKPAQMLLKYRLGEIERKLNAARAGFVMSRTHYAGGVLAIRRERKAGLHLDLDQRGALFRALLRTPALPAIKPTYADQARDAAKEAVAEGVRLLSERSGLAKTPLGDLGKIASERIESSSRPDVTFGDQYETLLFLAGTLFDRIHGSISWHSEYFDVQRNQLDLSSELVQIAVDTAALQSISEELEDALFTAGESGARQRIRTRQDALEGVWNELVGRVAALMRIDDALTDVEARLRSYVAERRAENLDHRIDDLLSRSGARELSAENIHHVSEQVSGVDEVIAGYQQLLYGDIAELTGRDQ